MTQQSDEVCRSSVNGDKREETWHGKIQASGNCIGGGAGRRGVLGLG
jgi:hypothetical protein